MKIDFRIDWGYNMLYSRRHYHPVYHWDGHLECSNASELKVSMREYPPAWWGPCHTARGIPLDRPEWQSSTRRKIAGIRVTADCGNDAVFKLTTLSGIFTFSAQDIISKGHFSFPVGPKYAFCAVTVCRAGYLWFRPDAKAGSAAYEASDLALPQVNSQRMQLAMLKPGETLDIPVKIQLPPGENSYKEILCHLQAMILEPGKPEGQNHAAAEILMTILANNTEAAEFTHYFRYHDGTVQLLEDVWTRFQIESEITKISLKNCHNHYPLCISRLVLEPKTTGHLQMTVPVWGLSGDTVTGKIFALYKETVEIKFQGTTTEVDLEPGWNEFDLTFQAPGRQLKVTALGKSTTSEAFINAVYALRDENPEVMVGYDMTVVPHDDNGFMDWLLDYTGRTQLGNTVVFRNFRPSSRKKQQPRDSSLKRWGEFCRRRKIHAQSVNCHQNNSLPAAAGEYMHNAGRHEYPGVVYAQDPQKGSESTDMKNACERYIAFIKADVDEVKQMGLRPAYGDASGGHRYCYLAGTSFIRSETMVPHTQHLCSQARPAAEALGKGDWGVHIAIQHGFQLNHPEHHLGLYFLSLYQPWMMGASMIYEEDSLFQLFKEERQCWDDALTKGKRDMTREFFRFVKTHPRTGKAVRNIAFYEGRYAAPFNGFICGCEQDPDYSVWGKFGNNAPEWGHRQPEKCRHLLDVLMPGASVHPLRQHYEKRRFYFSGTPYGDFDEVPAEVSADYMKQYRLLLNFGWNTMIKEDYEKLKDFVVNGGTLFTGIPQFSTHIKRDFLADMEDLALWNNGDLTELCGVKIIGKGKTFKGNWNAAGRMKFETPELSRLPNDSVLEDGECCLADIELRGAVPVAWDADSGAAAIVKYKLGKGTVYLICAWAYPGHEVLSDLVSAWTAKLSDQHRGDFYVEDPSREVFWTYRHELRDCTKIMLLNTDWSNPGNQKPVIIHTPVFDFTTAITEREPKIITIVGAAALETSADMNVEIISNKAGKIRIHGVVNDNIIFHKPSGSSKLQVDFQDMPYSDIEL